MGRALLCPWNRCPWCSTNCSIVVWALVWFHRQCNTSPKNLIVQTQFVPVLVFFFLVLFFWDAVSACSCFRSSIRSFVFRIVVVADIVVGVVEVAMVVVVVLVALYSAFVASLASITISITDRKTNPMISTV